MASCCLDTDFYQLGLGQAAACNRHCAALVDPVRACRPADGSEECVGGVAYQSIENKAWAPVENLADNPVEIELAHRDVAFGQHDAAGRQHGLAHDLIVLPGPDVVRSKAISAGAAVPQQVLG